MRHSHCDRGYLRWEEVSFSYLCNDLFFPITLNTSTILQVIWYCNSWLKLRYVLQNWQHVWGGTNTTVICFTDCLYLIVDLNKDSQQWTHLSYIQTVPRVQNWANFPDSKTSLFTARLTRYHGNTLYIIHKKYIGVIYNKFTVFRSLSSHKAPRMKTYSCFLSYHCYRKWRTV